ncbi:NAD(P)-dependent dehydrogenase, short-chain alcohol dehydrogenase family [Fontibacillus panacisegetis]|uniref:NAD(P)-dependent dehydrogenase, short-chain alcohol dehydrogenase family n=1 Tax=Fontibacillus panacisegetis TaxID=670482 RepID=A0A1G7IVY6_9BACL|nr:SDR family oxidoreductase [Fontibacillus panacisegetis]SDF16775.1 NAD(P)-dependent dehydrogenase, short-chain alcohol dehydrogenase family [Fontibacillus panacisegetis]
MRDYFKYKDKVCVVTGAASGMGKSTTEMLVDLGAEVYALDWNQVEVKGIFKYIHVDLSSKESIDEAFNLLPDTIDSFFGIAGVSGITTDFNKTVIIDFIANKYISEAYLTNRMKEDSGIVFITSTGGLGWEKENNQKEYMPLIKAKTWEEAITKLDELDLNRLPGPLGYSFAKLAMNYYVAHLQTTFASKHIRVNAILPGSTDTGLTGEFSAAAGGADKLMQYTGFADRLATPREMGEPAVFLNSHMASYISGALLIVDYGSGILSQAGLQQDSMGGATFDKIKLHFLKK